MHNDNTPPKNGYTLPLWNQGNQYRSTALAYMERENVTEVENNNGRTYTKNQVKGAVNEYVPSLFNQL